MDKTHGTSVEQDGSVLSFSRQSPYLLSQKRCTMVFVFQIITMLHTFSPPKSTSTPPIQNSFRTLTEYVT